eukprot:4193595-Amphidinium_carterae.1
MERFSRVLQHTDIIKLSDEDLTWLDADASAEDESSLRHAAKGLLDKSSASMVVVTLGDAGAFAIVRTADSQVFEVSVSAAKTTSFADTVGAGDVFGATLLAALVREDKLSAEAVRSMSASDVGSLVARAQTSMRNHCQRERP